MEWIWDDNHHITEHWFRKDGTHARNNTQLCPTTVEWGRTENHNKTGTFSRKEGTPASKQRTNLSNNDSGVESKNDHPEWSWENDHHRRVCALGEMEHVSPKTNKLVQHDQWSGVGMMIIMQSHSENANLLSTITSTPLPHMKMLMPMRMQYPLLRRLIGVNPALSCPNDYGHLYLTHQNHSRQHRHFCPLLNEHHDCPQPSKAHSS